MTISIYAGKRIEGETSKVNRGFLLMGPPGHTGFVAVTAARKAVASGNGQDIRGLGPMSELTDISEPRLLLSCCSILPNPWLPPYDLIWLPRSFPHICLLPGGKGEREREGRFLSFFSL